jgi:hypothetical protein
MPNFWEAADCPMDKAAFPPKSGLQGAEWIESFRRRSVAQET